MLMWPDANTRLRLEELKSSGVTEGRGFTQPLESSPDLSKRLHQAIQTQQNRFYLVNKISRELSDNNFLLSKSNDKLSLFVCKPTRASHLHQEQVLASSGAMMSSPCLHSLM